MGRMYGITQEEIEGILRFVNSEDGGAPLPCAEAAARLQNICYALQRKTAARAAELERSNARLEARAARLERREDGAAARGEFDDTGADSVDVALAVLHELDALGVRCTRTRVVYILYEMYASWLARHRRRLFIEHPVATEWGPQFWRVYKRLEGVSGGGPEAREGRDRLAASHPAVAVFARRAAAKYCDYQDKDFRDHFTKSFPYRRAAAPMNGGKWNREIADADIYEWKSETRK